jgi:hypothetical protein
MSPATCRDFYPVGKAAAPSRCATAKKAMMMENGSGEPAELSSLNGCSEALNAASAERSSLARVVCMVVEILS